MIKNKIKIQLRETFSSLWIRNYRLFFIGQSVSMSGTWMQSVAQAWLILKLTGSGTALGAVMALQFLPILFFGLFGGVIADRYDKRKILLFTQAGFGILAAILGTLVITQTVQIWMIYVMAFSFGLINAVDNPVRQSFLLELVGKDEIKNAVTLNTTVFNLARIIGPIIAAVIIATLGLGLCFYINAATYLIVITSLVLMKKEELVRKEIEQKKAQIKEQIIEGLNYVKTHPIILNIIIMMAIVGTITYEFQTTLPMMAEFVYHGSEESYAALMAAFGVGAVIGGLISAGNKKTSPLFITLISLGFGITIIIASIMPNFLSMIIGLIFVGIISTILITSANAMVQMESSTEMRGRVMSLWTIAMVGSTAIGAPLVGWIGEVFGARWSIAVGGIAAIIAGAYGLIVFKIATKTKETNTKII